MKRLDAYLFGEVALVRPYLLAKAMLLLLAFDCWVMLAGRGAWYGVGGFNVAHFALLDLLAPLPSSALYVGVVLLAGLLALTMVLGKMTRVGVAAVFTLYTYAWSMSMLDSFQHHYLLSLLLLSMIFFPMRSARELFDDVETSSEDGSRGVAWGYVSACVTAAIVYFYTAITKMDPDWRQGHALARLGRGSESAMELRGWFIEQGGTPAGFWEWMAIGAIAVQLVTSAGYLVAARRDGLTNRGARVAVTFWVLAPLSFHVGAELLNLKIGWFSYYMIAFALIAFAPAPWLETLTRGLSLPARALGASWDETPESGTNAKNERLMGAAIGGLVWAGLVYVGSLVDLPGAVAALGSLGLLMVVLAGREGVRELSLAALVASVILLAALDQDTVRFDFYRWVGGDLRRRSIPCQTEASYERCVGALEAYEQANRYAPVDQDRREKETEMRGLVEAGRARFGGSNAAGEETPPD